MADTITMGPGDGTLKLHTTRTGAAAKMGHDLTLEVKRWSATLTPTDDGSGLASLKAEAEAGSLEIVDAQGGAKALSDKDRADIKKSINEKVLMTSRNPTIVYTATGVEGSTIKGQLNLAGSTRPLDLTFSQAGDRITAKGSITQTDFGIKPYSALLGALKVGDVVGVSIDVKNPKG